MKILQFLALSLILLNSCADEKIIDDTDKSWQAIISVGGATPKLQLVEYPEGNVIEDDIYFTANSLRLNSAPDKIAEFGGFYFLMLKAEKKIIVINRGDYLKVAELDFTEDNKTPADIAFHLTTAYIIFENDSLVSPVDLTVFKKTAYINANKICSSIASDGNQVYITNPHDNSLSIIDTRVNNKVADISVPDVPVLVGFDRYGKAIVVTAGKGKYGDDTTSKTEAYVMLIDTASRQIAGKQPLGIGIVKPKEQIPLSLAVVSKLYVYVGTQQYLLRYNSRTSGSVVRSDDGYSESVIFNQKRDEILIIRNENSDKRLIVSPSQSFSENLNVLLPDDFVCIIPR